MTAEREGELFAKIDMLIGMAQVQSDRLNKLEVAVGRIEGRIDEQSRLLVQLVPQPLAALAKPRTPVGRSGARP